MNRDHFQVRTLNTLGIAFDTFVKALQPKKSRYLMFQIMLTVGLDALLVRSLAPPKPMTTYSSSSTHASTAHLHSYLEVNSSDFGCLPFLRHKLTVTQHETLARAWYPALESVKSLLYYKDSIPPIRFKDIISPSNCILLSATIAPNSAKKF
jgi:hypothetical protein